jgi:hypothetical protein
MRDEGYEKMRATFLDESDETGGRRVPARAHFLEAVAAVDRAPNALIVSGAPCRNSPMPAMTSFAICTKSLLILLPSDG